MPDKPDIRVLWLHYGGELRTTSREQSTRCIVHDETRASCSVNEEQGLFFCAACGAGGDAFDLIRAKEGFTEDEPFATLVAIAEKITGQRHSGVSAATPTGRPSARLSRGEGFKPRYVKSPLRRRAFTVGGT